MVLSGYTQVNGIGYIPKSWQVASANDLCLKVTKGTTPPKSEISDSGEIPFIRVNNLSFNGKLNGDSDFIYVSEDAHNNFLARSIAYPGDILMNIVGPPLGKTALLGDMAKEYNLNQAVLIYRPNLQKISPNFLIDYLNSYISQQWLQSRSKKTSGQQNLTIELCKEMPVPVPPLPEQKKIAEILSTWDQAITTTDQLLANSQQQKKSLMQHLLTGKKRLLDDNGQMFTGEWEISKFYEILDIKKGKQLNRDTLSETGVYAVINGGVTPSGYTEVSNWKANTVTISEGGNSCGYVGLQNSPFWLGGHCYAVDSKNFSVNFTYHLLKFHEHKIMRLRVGSGLPNIQKKDMYSLKLLYPNSSEEQQKIATVLTAADQEIDTLKQKLDHLKQEKKALMQQLLTGKRRVNVG